MEASVKKEIVELALTEGQSSEVESRPLSNPVPVIELSSSDSGSVEEDGGLGSEKSRDLVDDCVSGGPAKKRKLENGGAGMLLPLGFLDPLPPDETPPMLLPEPMSDSHAPVLVVQGCRQFWKAGDYDREEVADSTDFSVGMDHVRVHPKFLHSNATSHKWALGAFAELLDNALDEVCHGATFVNVDVLTNKKDGAKMLLIEDNGGGMSPDKMRQCMSLGYSAKSKLANTIGQYGNGFKTSTMRLGADVIVFSRCLGKGEKRPTQSIGLLSYTFLRTTGKEDIVVPMLDYEKRGQTWSKMIRSSSVDWNINFETIMHWSPYSSEADLLQQFSLMTDHGTRIMIYNLWYDDQGELELDFGADKHDIQVRGVSRDEKKIEMAKQFPNSRHFLTYRHSLRSYASILYLRLPPKFRIILRGKDIEHHNIVNDMMLKQEITYRPQPGADGVPKEPNMVAVVTIGFVKDAKDHIDVQGFNVYHKNRLIKPFWRVWNAAGSDGRGAIGVLEANFVEPAHDKQGFERTTVLARLEQRLIQMQKQYWSTYCHKIGYAPRRNKKLISAAQDEGRSPEELSQPSSRHSRKDMSPSSTPLVGKAQDSIHLQSTNKSHSKSNHKSMGKGGMSPIVSVKVGHTKHVNGNISSAEESAEKIAKKISTPQAGLPEHLHIGDDTDSDIERIHTEGNVNRSDTPRPSPTRNVQKWNSPLAVSSSPYLVANGTEKQHALKGGVDRIVTRSQLKEAGITCNGNKPNLEDPDAVASKQLKDENRVLKDRIKELEATMIHELQFEKDRNRSLCEKLEAAEKKLEGANKEQEALIDIFSEERNRRDKEEENLRKKLKESSATIQELLDRLSRGNHVKTER